MWGSFGVYIDLPKLDNSEVTMEARLTNNPEIEVRTKLVSYWGLATMVTSESSSFGKSIRTPKDPHMPTLKCLASITHYFCPDLYFRIIYEPGLHGHFCVLQFWQINMNPKRSIYLSLEVKTLISWPRCCCPIYIWPLQCSKLIKGGQRTEIGG